MSRICLDRRGFVVYYCLVLAVIIGFVLAGTQRSPIDRAFAEKASEQRIQSQYAAESALEICRLLASGAMPTNGSWTWSPDTNAGIGSNARCTVGSITLAWEATEQIGWMLRACATATVYSHVPPGLDDTFASMAATPRSVWQIRAIIDMATMPRRITNWQCTPAGDATMAARTPLWPPVATWPGPQLYGGSNDDFASSVIPLTLPATTTTDVLLVGSTKSTDLTWPNHAAGTWDGWIARVRDTATGPALLAERCYGGALDESFAGGVEMADGNWLLVGVASSTDGDVVFVPAGPKPPGRNRDAWAVIVASDTLAVAWQMCFGNTDDDAFAGALRTGSDSYLMYGCASLSTANATDGLLVTLNGPSRTAVLLPSIGGPGDERFTAATLTGSGAVLVIGVSSSTALPNPPATTVRTPTASGSGDGWIVCLSPGTLVPMWQTSIGGGQPDRLCDVRLANASGEFWVVGATQSPNGDLAANNGGWDAWVARLAPDGTLIPGTSRSFGGTGDEEFRTIRPMPDGSALVFGTTDSTDGDLTAINAGGRHVWSARIANDGTLIAGSSHICGGSGSDACGGVTRTLDGGFMIVGSSNSNDLTGWIGASDTLMIKTDETGAP